MLKVDTQGRGTFLFSSPLAMSNKNAKPDRSWQEIAAEAAHEANPDKRLELSNELAVALDQRKRPFAPQKNQ